jgi:hypothetical protein
MDEILGYIDIEEVPQKGRGRRGDGGVYLVVADETEEFQLALRYAARRAEVNRGHVGILYVTPVEDFVHWSNVEARMRREAREQAEKFAWNVAKKVNDLNGLTPALYLREGVRTDCIVDCINEDLSIRMLVLAGGTHSAGPGPLVSYFTGKGLARLRVPVMIVPGYLEPHKIDAVAL